MAYANKEYFAGHKLSLIYDKLFRQIKVALSYKNDAKSYQEITEEAQEKALGFIRCIPEVQALLCKDVEAEYNGDPAANSREEIIFSYPGLFAIFVYRYAHVLYQMKVPFIPRIMTEYAHGETGIDINPGANIGEYFFIDHGTGIVIGETTDIGNNVKSIRGYPWCAVDQKGPAVVRCQTSPNHRRQCSYLCEYNHSWWRDHYWCKFRSGGKYLRDEVHPCKHQGCLHHAGT